MRAQEFMTTDVLTVRPGTGIPEASRLLLSRGFQTAPVLDDDGRLVGVVTQTDLLHGHVGADPRAHLRPAPPDQDDPPHTVGQAMSKSIVALPDTADPSEFANVMLQHKLTSVPVTSGGRLVGIVTISDLLRTQVRPDADVARDVTQQLREFGGPVAALGVDVVDAVVTISGETSERERRIAAALAETVTGAVKVRHEPISAPDPPVDRRGLRILGLDECLDRLRQAPIGRLGFMRDGGPVVLPVKHGLDDTNVVFRTTWGSKLLIAQRQGPVAFEVDGIDEETATGWSVVVTGTAAVVTDDDEADRLERLGVPSWTGVDENTLWVRILAEEISGREILHT